jgi:hypothetical protein
MNKIKPIKVKSSKRSVRKLMGVKGFTTSGRGLTSYCIGNEYTPKDLYDQAVTNLTTELGEPQHVDSKGCKYWLVEGVGIVFVPSYHGMGYQYVECDKYGSEDYFNNFVTNH